MQPVGHVRQPLEVGNLRAVQVICQLGLISKVQSISNVKFPLSLLLVLVLKSKCHTPACCSTPMVTATDFCTLEDAVN